MAEDKVLDYQSEHGKEATRFQIKEYLLMGGGPTNASDRVLKALGVQCLTPIDEQAFSMIEELKPMIRYLFQTKNPLSLISQTSGNGGNETIINNLLDAGDRLVIAIGGFWGEKVLDIAQRYDVDTLALRKPPGEIFSHEELEEAIKNHKAKMLFVTHGESTGGILQKLEGLGPLCHKYGCLLAVDAVVSIAVDPLFVDRWELDAVSAGSQKAIGAPAGMCLLTFSPRAEKVMKAKKTKPPYYMDVQALSLYWKCEEAPRQYHYTFSTNMLAALREALAQICEEGLVEMWERHRQNTRYFWKRLGEIGMECFVEKEENRFHGVTGVNIPKGVDQMELLAFLREKYAIDITPGHGPTLGKAMRVGIMGGNSRKEVVDYLIKAFQDGITNLRK